MICCSYHLLKEKAINLPVESGRVKQFHCAFFDFTGGANQNGAWSYRGVKTEVINDTHVRCNASHLTSFVVLVSVVADVSGPPVSLDVVQSSDAQLSYMQWAIMLTMEILPLNYASAGLICNRLYFDRQYNKWVYYTYQPATPVLVPQWGWRGVGGGQRPIDSNQLPLTTLMLIACTV